MNRPLTDGGRMASGAGGGAIVQRTVWPHRVVLASPPFDQDLQHPAVLRARRQKGIGPDVMAVRRAAADAGPVRQPQPPLLGLFASLRTHG